MKHDAELFKGLMGDIITNSRSPVLGQFAATEFISHSNIEKLGKKYLCQIYKGELNNDKSCDMVANGAKYIIKTARISNKTNSFLFLGINPTKKYDHLILFGICNKLLVLDLTNGFTWDKYSQRWYIKILTKWYCLVQIDKEQDQKADLDNYKLLLSCKTILGIVNKTDKEQTTL